MSARVHGEITVVERTERVHLFTPDGSVNLLVVGLRSIPRTGETVELGPNQLYEVQHVRWNVIPGSGILNAATVTARVLLRQTDDPVMLDNLTT